MTMHTPEFIGRMSLPAFPDMPSEVLRQAVTAAAEAHRVTVKEIMAPTRGRKAVSDARRDVFATLRAAGWSTPRIGRAMGRDHTTVMHGLRRATSTEN